VGDVWVGIVWAYILISVWLRGKIWVGEWCCKVWEVARFNLVARCGVALCRSLIKFVRVCGCVCIWLKVTHKKTLFYMEQLLLKHRAHVIATGIKQVHGQLQHCCE